MFVNNLSKRQLECVLYLARGKTTKEIARILNVSPRTIESHFVHIKDKINCRTKSEILDKAIAEGILIIILNKTLQR